MRIEFDEQDGVIIRRFTGEFEFEDILDSWNTLLTRYPRLEDYNGILSNFLEASIEHQDANLNVLVEFLKSKLEELKDLKIAIVMDTPLVPNTIIVGQRVKSLQIKPFSTVEAAMSWINS